MKITNKNIVGKVSDITCAVDELLAQDLGLFYDVLSPYGLKLDSSEILDDVEVRDDGVYVPTEYYISYRGSNEIDDPEEWEVLNIEKKYSIEELQKIVDEISN